MAQNNNNKTIRKINTRQLITPANDPYEFHVRTYKNRLRLQHKDSLLENRGISDARAVELYLDIVTDDQVYTSWDKQMVEIEARPWHVVPAKKTKKGKLIAEFVTDVLENLELNEEDEVMGFMLGTTSSGYNDLIRALGLGVISGISPLSVQWTERRSKYYPILRAVDPARVLFEASEDGTKIFPKILTRRHYTHGIMAPSKSLILYRYWAIPNGDPYFTRRCRVIGQPGFNGFPGILDEVGHGLVNQSAIQVQHNRFVGKAGFKPDRFIACLLQDKRFAHQRRQVI